MKQIIIAGIAAIGLIIAFYLIGDAYKYKFRAEETIVVTGSSETDFESDQVVWEGRYSRKEMDIKSAYAAIKADEIKIRKYLKDKAVADSEMVFSAIQISKDYSYFYDENGRQRGSEFTGYNLRQTVTVDSRDIDKVDRISREVTELIESGIELNSDAPSYYYTKLSELKIDLLAKASADAKLRATTIAENAGSKLGNIRKASMGVFQITGENMNEEYSYGGVFNTSSKNKTATVTTRIEFELD